GTAAPGKGGRSQNAKSYGPRENAELVELVKLHKLFSVKGNDKRWSTVTEVLCETTGINRTKKQIYTHWVELRGGMQTAIRRGSKSKLPKPDKEDTKEQKAAKRDAFIWELYADIKDPNIPREKSYHSPKWWDFDLVCLLHDFNVKETRRDPGFHDQSGAAGAIKAADMAGREVPKGKWKGDRENASRLISEANEREDKREAEEKEERVALRLSTEEGNKNMAEMTKHIGALVASTAAPNAAGDARISALEAKMDKLGSDNAKSTGDTQAMLQRLLDKMP
ncbi:hypothetical protein B484DRAFT_409738, partial [Ochromonadaceae sp. CCMP2298]